MGEREKGLCGQLYNPNYDKEIIKLREKMQDLCFQYNNILPSKIDERNILIKSMVGKIGNNYLLEQPVYFDYGTYTHFGKGTFVNHGCYFMDGGTIHIGENVFIGPFCGFYTASHPINYADRNKGLERALPIVVGDNCWFGANVSVMQGVTIGAGCVIAAGSVVTKDIPENCLVAGVPATIKKRINQ